MKTTKSNFRKIFILAVLFFIGLTYYANYTVINATKAYNTGNINEISFHKVGLLLGTSKYVRTGVKNEYFFNRIDATLALYKANKIKYVIISGDNSKKNYNEPQDMKDELIKGGIPDSLIILDYAGFRTLDAVVRAKEIFGQDSFLIISQKFHNERAIYLARNNDINAFGLNAKDVEKYSGIKTKIREFFARDKMFLDLLIGTKPKFLGKKIIIK